MTAAPGTLRSTLRAPGFAPFWLAQGISKFGDPITLVALAATSYGLTGSALVTSLAVLIATVPQATFGFFAGAIADALGHRRAMVAVDLLRAFLIGSIPLLLAAGLPLAFAYVAVLLAATSAAVFGPARSALVPTIVSARNVAAGNSLIFATDRAMEICGALAGGLLVAAIGPAAFYVDAATFAVSALLLARVTVEEDAPRRVSIPGAIRDAAAGLTFIGRSAVLLPNTVFSLMAQLYAPVFNGLLPVFVFRRFASLDEPLGATLYGLSEGAIAFGAVGGSLLYAQTIGHLRKGRVLLGGFLALGLGIVLVSAAPTFELALVALAFVGLANVASFVPNISISQEATPAQVRGRVFGARMSLLSLTWLPVTLVAGTLADRFPVSLLIGVAGAFTLLVALAGTQIRALTEVE